MESTHYQVLGLKRDASMGEVAGAYREKMDALKSQPDGGGYEETMAVRLAFQVLSSPTSRAEYDASLRPQAGAKGVEAPAGEAPEPGLVEQLKDVLSESGALKFVIPVVVLVAIAIYFKMRQPSQEYRAPPRVVEMAAQAVPPAKGEYDKDEGAPDEKDGKGEAKEGAAPSITLPADAPAKAGPMTPEELFTAVAPSVARILVMDSQGKTFGQGSGVVVGSGIVITNCHVVAEAWKVSVKVGDKELPGKVVVADKEFDLCSLNVAGLNAPSVSVSGADAQVGQKAYAIGAPQGLELTLSEGIVSSLRPTAKGTILQTTAPVSPGSSGGGLFNAKGELIGVVTFQHRGGQNLNFAVPASWLSEMKHRDASGTR